MAKKTANRSAATELAAVEPMTADKLAAYQFGLAAEDSGPPRRMAAAKRKRVRRRPQQAAVAPLTKLPVMDQLDEQREISRVESEMFREAMAQPNGRPDFLATFG